MGRFFKGLFITLAAYIVATILFLVAIGVVVGVAITSFTPEPKGVKRGTVLEINMNEVITDSPRPLPLIDLRGLAFGTTPEISTLAMLQALESGAADTNIVAISLRMDGMEQLPLAKAEELCTALENFAKTSEKPIYAYAENYSQVEYYLASVADKIYIHPMGQIEWQGVAMNMFFYGDLIERSGAHVEVFRPVACSYKSAVEPYTRSGMSPESREQSGRLVDELWSGVVGQVANSRGITPEKLHEVAAERILVEADEAQELGMVDVVDYNDIYNVALEEAGVRTDDGAIRRVTLASYYTGLAMNNDTTDADLAIKGRNKIAIIYVDGTIVDGVSDMSSNSNLVGSATIAKQLREARNDDDVKGVVLRVNSPGGSAMAADVMWREVELLKSEKMVVVSMGSYAASGGYYISAPADVILADRYTLTGSIGVYGMMVDYAEALSQHLHINIDGVGSSPSADFGRVPRAITPLERAAMMRSVDQVYETFTGVVSKGRNLPLGVVGALAGGRVWSGIEAESCGLVDGIGGLQVALNLVIDRCSLVNGDYDIVEMVDTPDEFEMLMSMFGMKVRAWFPIFTNGASELEGHMRALDGSNGVMMHTPERIN